MADIFKIGDTVYVPRAGSTERTRPCRICAGQRVVTLTLGSGEQVQLDCDYCGHGYEDPTGTEKYYDYSPHYVTYPVTGIERTTTPDGEKVTYRSGNENAWTNIPAEDCYATADEAMAHSAVKIAAQEAEQERRMAVKEQNNKTYAWHAGYHLREAKRAREQAEYHERKAVLMKAQAKEPS